MSIADGQPVDAANSNPAWWSKNTDDQATGRYDLLNTVPASGPNVFNMQREFNSLNSFTGRPSASAWDAVPAWAMNYTGSPTDHLMARIEAIDQKFANSPGLGGHSHNGTDGQGPQISADTIQNVPYKGVFLQGVDLIGVTGDDLDVSTELTGKSPSGGQTSLGVCVTNSQNENKGILRHASGAQENEAFEDGSGNIVYSRLTEAAGVWTLSFYTDVGGVETPFSFTGEDVRWYYQELFNPLDLATFPVYSELAIIPSDNTTADVITATTALQGKVSLAAVAPADIAATGSAGTPNASVANRDHTHKGVYTTKKLGDADIHGTVTIEPGTNINITQTGNNIKIDAVVVATVTRAATEALGNGVSSKVVTFSTPLASTNYAISAMLQNITDANPQFQPVTITAKTVNGFTATWNAPTDSANYSLEYMALMHA